MSSSFLPSSGNPFHYGPTIHTHQKCGNCGTLRRCGSEKFRGCSGCASVYYCSTECHQSHWKYHKGACKAMESQNKYIKEKTGHDQAHTDLMRWFQTYKTPIRNGMVAALDLPNRPHQERKSVLIIEVTHENDSTLPPDRRFTVDGITLVDGNQNSPGEKAIAKVLDSSELAAAIAFDLADPQSRHYGGAMFIIVATVKTESAMEQFTFRNLFAIDKTVASAKVAPGPWEPRLRQILESKEKTPFCCGLVEQGECCCKGVVHDTGKISHASRIG